MTNRANTVMLWLATFAGAVICFFFLTPTVEGLTEAPIKGHNAKTIDHSEHRVQSALPASIITPVSTDPASHFLDMLAAPVGAPITVYGPATGNTIVVGDRTLTDCPITNETVYDIAETGRRLAKTTCWLKDVPLGKTTASGLSFTVIKGRVRTIKNFAAFKAAMANPQPGDVYLLKSFTASKANGKANGGNSSLWMRGGEHHGPIALVGYPGAPATFKTGAYHVNFKNSLKLDNNNWTVSNLTFDNRWMSAEFKGPHRIVGNRFKGLQNFPKAGSGTGTVVLSGNRSGGSFLGNVVNGGRSQWRFDHALYLSDCPDRKGWNVGYNYIHSNSFGRGPHISINHQPPRCGKPPTVKILAQHTIHNNTIDSSFYRGKCIGQNSVGRWEKISPAAQKPTLILRNDLIECGFANKTERDHYNDLRRGDAINISRGGAVIWNNRLYRPEGEIIGNKELN